MRVMVTGANDHTGWERSHVGCDFAGEQPSTIPYARQGNPKGKKILDNNYELTRRGGVSQKKFLNWRERKAWQFCPGLLFPNQISHAVAGVSGPYDQALAISDNLTTDTRKLTRTF